MEKVIEIEAVPTRKIVSLDEEFESYYIDDIKKLDFDLFVFSYKTGSYDGSGFAVWKKDDKFFYHEMGHCSCNGPLENLQTSAKTSFTLEDIEKIAEKGYDDHAKKVVAYIKAHA